jgi:hypothetical protein
MVTLAMSWWLNFYWLLNLMFISYPLARQELLTPKILQGKAVAAVQKLFEVSGYKVNLFFRTGKVEIDSLLTDLNFLAVKGEQAFAVEVIIASTSSKITSKAAIFDLLTVAWTLTNFFQDSSKEPTPYVKPLFVVVALEQFPFLGVADEIATWKEEMNLQPADLSWTMIDQILKLEDKKKLKLIAHEFFDTSET